MVSDNELNTEELATDGELEPHQEAVAELSEIINSISNKMNEDQIVHQMGVHEMTEHLNKLDSSKTLLGKLLSKQKISPEKKEPDLEGIIFETDLLDENSSPFYNYEINIVVDSEHEYANHAVYNKDSNCLNIYLHEGYGLLGDLPKDFIANNIINGNYVIHLKKTGVLTIVDPSMLRACKYFTADQATVSSVPVTMGKLHEYDKAFSVPSCAHPDMSDMSPPMCQVSQTQQLCEIYEPELWASEKAYKSGNETLALQSVRRNLGFKHYRVISVTDEGKINIIFSSNTVDDGDDAHTYSLKVLHGEAEQRLDAVELTLNGSQEPEVKYYDYAFG